MYNFKHVQPFIGIRGTFLVHRNSVTQTQSHPIYTFSTVIIFLPVPIQSEKFVTCLHELHLEEIKPITLRLLRTNEKEYAQDFFSYPPPPPPPTNSPTPHLSFLCLFKCVNCLIYPLNNKIGLHQCPDV